MKDRLWYPTALCAVLLLFACAPEVVDVDDGTGNGGNNDDKTDYVITGSLLRSDGTTPATGVNVVIRPANALAMIGDDGLPEPEAPTGSILTDSAGGFSFDTSLDTGTYMIEASNNDEAAVIDSVAVRDKDSTITLSPRQLKPTGTIRGTIVLEGTDDPSGAFVLLFGIGRFVRVGSDGSFQFSGIAEGRYDLRILPGTATHATFDLTGIAVQASETSLIDTMRLAFQGIPVPRGLMIACDPGSHLVTLSWNRTNVASVAGYNVYRRNIDSNTVYSTPLNGQPLNDTIFIDSTVTQEMSYEYRIAAVDTDGAAGVKSEAMSVTVATYFSMDTSFTANAQDIAVTRSGLVFAASSDSFLIDVYDAGLHFLRHFGSGHLRWPHTIAIDESGTIFVASSIDTVPVAVFDSSEQFTGTVAGIGKVIDLVAKNGSLYIINGQPGDPNGIYSSGRSITVYGYDGTPRRSWYPENDYAFGSIANGNGDSLFLSNFYQISLYDTLGRLLSAIPVSNQVRPRSLAYDGKKGLLYYVGRMMDENRPYIVLYMLDSTFSEIGTYARRAPLTCPYDGLSIALGENGDAYLSLCFYHLMRYRALF